jgi:DNA-binding XRE family transcriptional regulator
VIAGAQVRAARALLNLSQNALSAEAGITRATLVALENEKRLSYSTTVERVVSALEKMGIVFLDDHQGHVGVVVETERLS